MWAFRSVRARACVLLDIQRRENTAVAGSLRPALSVWVGMATLPPPDPASSPARPAWNEADRLAALERYAILDTPREAEFDDVARLAADIFEAPIAVVNLIAAGRQWFKAEVGIGADELPLDVSICAHAILQAGVFVVPDLTRDDRFACNPLVTPASGLRFYAGALLETPEGLPLGTVCVLDTKPRPEGIDARQTLTLEVLARQVMTQLELRRAVSERDRRSAALAESEERLRLAVENADVGFWDVDVANDVLIWPPVTKAMFGISAGSPVTMQDFYDGLHPEDRDKTTAVYAAAADPRQRALYDAEYRTIGKEDGLVRWVAAKGRGVFDADGRCVRVVGTAVEITPRKVAEQALRDLNATLESRVAAEVAERRLLADLVEGTDAFVQVLDPDFRWLAVNRAAADEFERIYGVRPQVGLSMLDLLNDAPEHRAAVEAVWARALAGEEFTEVGEFGDPGRARRSYEMKYHRLRDGEGRQIGAYQFVYDVTERVQEQRRLAEAEDALRQAQKMEAVGQLTGGIAHDFNNMLAVVIGSLDLLKRRIGDGDLRALRYVDAAVDGARRAALLTQRLLAFSRQQPLKPESVDVNALVAGMSDLLRHSLGGAVRLETVLAGGLWRTSADPNQLESVILNLAINARDAMPGGGRLTIETQNAHLDDRYAAAHLGVSAGQYVLIAVTDTGEGMPADVIAKAFDPFFTTKEVGKGTGLGLSQVYGFVRQSGGHVKIYSEPGQGTTLKVYLPRLSGAPVDVAAAGRAHVVPLGEHGEVVLVVEDEAAVRRFSVDALEELGYRVLEADGAAAALQLLEAHPEIALLFTDVIMPEVNGARLAEAARARRPDLKVLFTTGYTRNAVVHNGVLDADVQLLGKPFTVEDLAAKVREVLDEPRSVDP